MRLGSCKLVEEVLCPRFRFGGLLGHEMPGSVTTNFHDSLAPMSKAGQLVEMQSSGIKRAVWEAESEQSKAVNNTSKRPRNDSPSSVTSKACTAGAPEYVEEDTKPCTALSSKKLQSCSFIGVRWSQIKGKWR